MFAYVLNTKRTLAVLIALATVPLLSFAWFVSALSLAYWGFVSDQTLGRTFFVCFCVFIPAAVMNCLASVLIFIPVWRGIGARNFSNVCTAVLYSRTGL